MQHALQRAFETTDRTINAASEAAAKGTVSEEQAHLLESVLLDKANEWD